MDNNDVHRDGRPWPLRHALLFLPSSPFSAEGCCLGRYVAPLTCLAQLLGVTDSVIVGNLGFAERDCILT